MIYKSSHSLQSQILSNIDAENTLLLNEASVQSIDKVFLPDHLGVNCKTGREMFKVAAGLRVSFIARPKTIAPCYIHHCAFEGKHFTTARIYYKGALRDVMVLSERDPEQQARIDIMDITDPKKPSLLKRFDKTVLEIDNITQATIIRLANGSAGLAFGGSREAGLFKIILLDNLGECIEFTTDAKDPLIQVSAIALEGGGLASRLYGIDALGHVWVVSLQDIHHRHRATRLTQDPIGFSDYPPLFIKHEDNDGLWIYLLGKDARGLDLVLKLQDKLSERVEPTQAKELKKGHFQGMWLRGGQLKLLTKSQGIAEAELMWDAKNREEVLLIIDAQCQVRMLSASLKEIAGPRNRISIRKLMSD